MASSWDSFLVMNYSKSFLIFSIFLNLSVVLQVARCDVTQRTNLRCEEICNELKLVQSHKFDCQRGCRYFNIEFLTGASNKGGDLGWTADQCKASCHDAYSDRMKKDACDLGCVKMYEVQAKAPLLHGWLVYMGASDRSMVVVQPDIESLRNDNEQWVLLDSIFRPHDYNENEMNSGSPFKLTETRIQTMPVNNRLLPVRIHNQFCIPILLWLIPIMLLFALIWIQYGPTIRSVFIFEDESEDEDQEHEVITIQRPPSVEIKKSTDNFVVTFDSFFYPAASNQDVVLMPEPPPKYDDYQKYPLLLSKDPDSVET